MKSRNGLYNELSIQWAWLMVDIFFQTTLLHPIMVHDMAFGHTVKELTLFVIWVWNDTEGAREM